MKLAAILLSTLLFFVITAPARAINHGAIAFDSQTQAFGVSWDMPSQEGANLRAEAECYKNGKGCHVVATFVDRCGAYAAGPDNIWGSGFGPTRQVAERWALNYCAKYGGGCQIKAWGCNSQPQSGGNFNSDSIASPIDRDANRRRAEESRAWGGEEQYRRICDQSGGC